MKKILSILVTLILAMAVLPATIGVSTGGGIGMDITPEDFEPLIWLCDSRAASDDYVEPGRVTEGGDEMTEREHNYAFEGEQIEWNVLVMDKNGKEKIEDVYVTVDENIEANCQRTSGPRKIPSSCNARILEEKLVDFNPDTMDYYECTLTVETPATMQGEFWVVPVVEDLEGNDVEADEQEKWFMNPVIALAIDGDIEFDEVRPGTSAYSSTITVGNDAEEGSGVMMDMFISGTDFYDNDDYGTKCPDSNVLRLTNFNYYATSGAYDTFGEERKIGAVVGATSDPEGYLNIPYADHFSTGLYGVAEILPTATNDKTSYSAGNVLSPGADISITFRLDLPEPCNADNFDDGDIYFWGEAV